MTFEQMRLSLNSCNHTDQFELSVKSLYLTQDPMRH